RTNLLNYRLGRKWRAPLSDHVEHAGRTLFVTDRHREGIVCAARWINEARVAVHAIKRPLANIRISTRCNSLRGDEALDVAPKFGEIFRRKANRVLFVFCVQKLLGQLGV